MDNFKTLEQIKTETLNTPTTKRYYRSFDYARSIALTRYLETLTSNETFAISSVAPLQIVNRDAEDATATDPVFVVGMWCWFLLQGVAYYVQMTDNPFFPAYVSRSIEVDKRTYADTGLVELNNVFYKNVAWDAEPETIDQLVKNIAEAVERSKKVNCKFKRDRLSYRDQFKKQEVYLTC